MDDGLVVRADVLRPDDDEKHPVILTYGPYGKGLHFQDGSPGQWNSMCAAHPDVPYGSSNIYANFEVVDPEKWVPDGYVCLRIDSRGTGCTDGVNDPFSARETKDLYNCIEWAAVQPWSNGKIGLNGISYYAVNAMQVASLPSPPPHLVAICAWEGFGDYYRDTLYHGGIYCGFQEEWYERRIQQLQYGFGDRGFRSRVTGQNVCGDVTLSNEELQKKRIKSYGDEILSKPLDSPYYRERSSVMENIKVPLLSAANWGGVGLHPRGNFDVFVKAASEQKWLETHGLEHWVHFYTDYGVALQKKFFGYFLKGEDNGWDKQPRVLINARHPGNKYVPRGENEWPLARTQWTKFYLSSDFSLSTNKPSKSDALTYKSMGDGLTFLTEPFEKEVELCGPCASKLFISSDTVDADLFLVLRLFTPDMKEVTFQGSHDPHTPISFGWLRASHRKLDPQKTSFHTPYHTHDEIQPLEQGKVYELDIEIWATSIVIPKGYRLGLSVRGKDYETAANKIPYASIFGAGKWSGVGPFTHKDPRDRVKEVFHNNVTLHFDGNNAPYVLLPVIPD